MAQERCYVAYGERTPDLLEALLQRPIKGEPAVITGFRLCVQATIDVPDDVRTILAIGRTEEQMSRLRAYGAVPTSDEDAFIKGMLVRGISDQDMNILNMWDIEGLWFEHYKKQVVHIRNDDSSSKLAMADFHANPRGTYTFYDEPYEGLFPPSLNDPIEAAEIARAASTSFLSNEQ